MASRKRYLTIPGKAVAVIYALLLGIGGFTFLNGGGFGSLFLAVGAVIAMLAFNAVSRRLENIFLTTGLLFMIAALFI